MPVMTLPGSTMSAGDNAASTSSTALPVAEGLEVLRPCTRASRGSKGDTAQPGEVYIAISPNQAKRVAWPHEAEQHLLASQFRGEYTENIHQTPSASHLALPSPTPPQRPAPDPALAAYIKHCERMRATVNSLAKLKAARADQLRHLVNSQASQKLICLPT